MSLFDELRKKATDTWNKAVENHPEFKQRAEKLAGEVQVLGLKAADELQKRAPGLKDKAIELGHKAAQAVPPAIEQLKTTLASVQGDKPKGQTEQK